jgi:hypothetical protein
MSFLDRFTSWFRPRRRGGHQARRRHERRQLRRLSLPQSATPTWLATWLWETISNMKRSAEIGHPLRKRQALAAKPKPSFEPCENGKLSDKPEAKEYADKAETLVGAMRTPWTQFVKRASLYDCDGFYVGVWTAEKREDGLIGIREIRPIAPSTIKQWAQDETGQVMGCVQLSPQDNQSHHIDRSRMVYLVDNSLDDSPGGLGLLRQAAESLRVLREYGRFEGIGFQSGLAGMPKVSLPLEALYQQFLDGGATETQALAQIETVKAPWQNFIENHNISSKRGVIVDSGVHKDITGNPTGPRRSDLELMVHPGGPQAEVAAAYVRLLFVINRLFGTDGDLLGSESTGTFALAKEKFTHLMLVVEAILGEICLAFDRDVLGPLWALNAFPPEWKPKTRTEPLQPKDVATMMAVLEGSARSGNTVQQGDPAIDVARAAAGLPPQPEVDPVAEGMLDRITAPEDDGTRWTWTSTTTSPRRPRRWAGDGEQDKPEENGETKRKRRGRGRRRR